MRRHTTLLLMLMLTWITSVSSSQEVDSATVLANQANVAIVRVNYKGGYDQQGKALEGSTSKGSGTYLGDRLFLSCAHNFRQDPDDGEYIGTTLVFIGGERIQANVLKLDPRCDQALLELETAPQCCTGIKIADRDPKIGDRVAFGGYGKGTALKLRTSTVLSFGSPSGAYKEDWFNVKGYAPQGDSGGPIFNAEGELIGNLWGSSGVDTAGTITTQTKVFLTQYMQRLQSCWNSPQSQFGSQTSQQPTLRRSPNSPYYRQPQSVAPSTPLPRPTTTPPPASEARNYVSLDYSRLALAIIKSEGFQEYLETELKGPTGNNADCSKLEASMLKLQQSITNLEIQVTSLKNTPAPQAPLKKWTHLILIAPTTAEYWPRLSDDLARAKDYYSEIRHVEAPTDRDIGPMPLLVAYSDGKPTSFRRVGYESVSHALYQITNGQFDMKTDGESN